MIGYRKAKNGLLPHAGLVALVVTLVGVGFVLFQPSAQALPAARYPAGVLLDTPGPTATFTRVIRYVQPSPAPTSTATPTSTPTPAPSAAMRLLAATERALPASDGSGRAAGVPILMYHYISAAPAGADRVRRDLSLSGPDFELQLRYLANEGYQSISLYDLVRHIQQGEPLPEKPIVLTFDDGYKDAYTVGFPLLKKYGFIGTFFVFTKPIDEENRDYLSWRDIELMSTAGMEFGSHSYSHPDLRGKGAEVLARELVASKEAIESHIGQPIRFFCYPSGQYDANTIQAARDAGYWGAVTVRQGILHSSADLMELTRIRIRGTDGLERFDALLNFNW